MTAMSGFPPLRAIVRDCLKPVGERLPSAADLAAPKRVLAKSESLSP